MSRYSPVPSEYRNRAKTRSMTGPHIFEEKQLIMTRGLSVEKKKQLFLDIDLAGGLSNTTCEDICNQKPNTYGKPNSKLRRQVQNAYSYLVNLTPLEYKQAYERSFLGYVKTRSLDGVSKNPEGTESDLDEEYDPELELELSLAGNGRTPSSSIKSTSSNKLTPFKSPRKPVPTSIKKASSGINRKPPSSIKKARPPPTPSTLIDIFDKNMTLDEDYSRSFTVNKDDPFDNGGLQVFPFFDRETPAGKDGKKFLVNGYDIRTTVDMGYLQNDKFYKAKLLDSTTIEFTLPKVPHYVIKPTTIKQDTKFTRPTNAQINSAANRVATSEEYQMKTVQLKFDSSEDLTNEIYSPSSTDGIINANYHPFEIELVVVGKTLSRWECEVEWTITVKETSMRLADAGTKTGDSERERLLKGAFGG